MNMEVNEITKYLRIILTLEKEKRTCYETRSRINQQIKHLGIPVVSEPKPLVLESYKKELWNEVKWCVLLLILSIIVFYIGIYIDNHWHVFYLVRYLASGIVGAIGLLGICISAYFIVISIIDTNRNRKSIIHDYDKQVKRYNHDKEIVESERAFAYELNKSIKILDNQCDAVNKVLTQYYDFIDLNKEYKGLVPISMFIHYLECKICSELEGPNGCYSYYRHELKLNIIIDKLDIVINKLDEMKETMNLFVEVINSSNAEIQYLCNKSIQLSEQNERIEKYQKKTSILIQEAIEKLQHKR